MEILSIAYGKLGLLKEEAPPPDGADTWLQSSYLLAEPRTLKAGKASGWERPWACEVNSGARKACMSPGWKKDGRRMQRAVHDGDLDWSMDVVVVRTAEKLIDVIEEKLTDEVIQPWVGELPSIKEAKEALKRLIPVLEDMRKRAVSEETGHQEQREIFQEEVEEERPQQIIEIKGSQDEEKERIKQGDEKSKDPQCDCHFSKEYIEYVLERIRQEGIKGNSTSGRLPGNIKATDQENAAVLGRLPPKTLRHLWMQRLREERAAVVARPVDLEALALARKKRGAVEAAFDYACLGIVQRHANDWGAIEPNDEAELLTID